MNKFKKIITKLLFPHYIIILLLIPLSIVMLVYSMVKLASNDLLQEAKDRIMNKFFNFFGNETRHIDLNNFHPESFISDKFIVPYLNFVKDNKKIFKIFYNNLNTFNTKEIYDLLLERLWIPICNKKGLNDLSIINYMSKFFLNGMTSIIIEWINNNCEDDIYFICEIIILCVRPSEDF